MENPRKDRALEIMNQPNSIRQIEAHTFKVKSQSGNGEYVVRNGSDIYDCTCPDFIFRYHKVGYCKHILAIKLKEEILKDKILKNRAIEPITVSDCLFCHSSNIKKFGIRRNKSGNIQRFVCYDCGKTFSVNIGFEKMKHNPQAITTAMQLYFSGESLRNTQKSLRLIGVQVSHQTIYKWIGKYVKLMESYIEKLIPNVSDTWRADELYVRIRGNPKYVFALMDDETRYWIAQEVASTKYKHDARRLFQLGKEKTRKKPTTLITDGLRAYHDAYNKEFWTRSVPRTKHINTIKYKGNMQNNKMERLNGEIRDREKVMRGLKREDTPILKGYQIFHNYIREHEGLDGKTPSEACGIAVKGKNKWITLIQNASRWRIHE